MCHRKFKKLSSLLFFLILLLIPATAHSQLCQQFTDEFYAWAESDIDFDDFSFLVNVGQNKPFPKDYVVTQDILEIFRTTKFYEDGKYRATILQEKYPQLLLEEIISIVDYSNFGYKRINSNLRKLKFEDIPLDTKAAILTLLSGLNKLKSFQGNVYRRGDISPDRLSEIKKARESKTPITESTFFSTSADPKLNNIGCIADFRDRNTWFSIETVSGVDIKTFSTAPAENEILIKPYTRFLVEKVVESVGEPTKIYLKEIHD